MDVGSAFGNRNVSAVRRIEKLTCLRDAAFAGDGIGHIGLFREILNIGGGFVFHDIHKRGISRRDVVGEGCGGFGIDAEVFPRDASDSGNIAFDVIASDLDAVAGLVGVCHRFFTHYVGEL